MMILICCGMINLNPIVVMNILEAKHIMINLSHPSSIFLAMSIVNANESIIRMIQGSKSAEMNLRNGNAFMYNFSV